MKPGALRTDVLVALVSKSRSCCWFAGSTVKTLIRITGLLFVEIDVINGTRGAEESWTVSASGSLTQAVALARADALRSNKPALRSRVHRPARDLRRALSP